MRGRVEEKRMMRGDAREILIHRQLIVDGASGKLAVKRNPRVDVRIEVESQAVTHPHVLRMRKSCLIRPRRSEG